MSNNFYNHTSGTPAALTRGTSSSVRAEFDAIAAGFDSIASSVMPLATESGTSNNFLITVTPTITANPTRGTAYFLATHGNTGAATVQFGLLATIPLLHGDGSALAAGAIASGSIVCVCFIGSNAYLMGATKSYVDTTFAPLTSPALLGIPTAPTAAPGTSTTQLATTGFVAAASLVAAGIPTQTGNAGKVLLTDGSAASWGSGLASFIAVVAGTTQTAVAGSHYILTNVSATTVTLPATPASGDTVWVTWTNTLTTNVIARNGQTIMGVAEDMTLDASTNGTVQLRFVNASWRIL